MSSPPIVLLLSPDPQGVLREGARELGARVISTWGEVLSEPKLGQVLDSVSTVVAWTPLGLYDRTVIDGALARLTSVIIVDDSGQGLREALAQHPLVTDAASSSEGLDALRRGLGVLQGAMAWNVTPP